ncbi:hypothetical protein K9M74_04500 [Candidatus Woesearchaeota archaeon]|nr:hypothetical protein [Candidatus Woesearchaeota archaeon]
MNYLAAQQEVDTWISQFKISYFQAHEIITQLAEENGEVSMAVLKEEKEEIAEELADVVFALICMSNSHHISLQATYKSIALPTPSTHTLTYAIGQVAREISHLYGPKKKKDSEERADLKQRLEETCVAVNQVAESYHINLDEAFQKHMDKLYNRDNNRWEKK